MKDFLSAVGAAVEDEVIASCPEGRSLRFGDLLSDSHNLREDCWSGFSRVSTVLFWNHQGVSVVGGVDVQKSEYDIVFIDFGGWNSAGNNF